MSIDRFLEVISKKPKHILRMVNPTVMDLVHYVNRYLQGKDSIEIFRDNLENIYDDANDINRELKSIPIVENIIRSSSEMLGAVKLTLMG